MVLAVVSGMVFMMKVNAKETTAINVVDENASDDDKDGGSA